MDAGFNQHYLTRHEITLGRRSEAESSKVLLLTRCQELRGNFYDDIYKYMNKHIFQLRCFVCDF